MAAVDHGQRAFLGRDLTNDQKVQLPDHAGGSYTAKS